MKPLDPVTFNMKRFCQTKNDQNVFETKTRAFPLMLAHRNVTAFEKETRAVIAQPKLDGIRVRYDPCWRQLITRGDQILECADHIVQAIKDQGLENKFLDGELYCHGMSFDAINKLIRGDSTEEKHLKLEFHIFDWFKHKTVIDRMHYLRSLNMKKPLRFVDTRMILTEKGIRKYYKYCRNKGYEGIMLRTPYSYYGDGRSRNLRRMKPIVDMEAKLVGFNKGKGRYSKTFGSLLLELPNGKRFSCAGIKHAVRERLFKEKPFGQLVTFLHAGFTDNKIPRHPRYKGIRTDLASC